jgi:hypothetical protein
MRKGTSHRRILFQALMIFFDTPPFFVERSKLSVNVKSFEIRNRVLRDWSLFKYKPLLLFGYKSHVFRG